jgi:hypothetical protein
VATLISWVLALLPSRPETTEAAAGRRDDISNEDLDERIDARAERRRDGRALTNRHHVTPNTYQ